jgi:hypothetical protein
MKRFAVGLMVAGIAAVAIGMGAGAVTTGAPTVSPSSGAPGFTFTVTVQGCALAESITFAFPPSPPNKVVVCAESSPPPPTSAPSTTAATTTTTSTTTTTVAPTTAAPTTEPTETTEPEECNPEFEECVVECEGQECDEFCAEVCDLLGIRSLPGQAASGTTASATFVAPQQPGTYQGTVTTGAGVQTFSVTVLGGQLPATGSDTARTTGYLAAVLLGSGAAMFAVARARRPEVIDR